MKKELPYAHLLRWIRESHVVVKDNEIVLPQFRHNNEFIKIYFDRISLSGFHHINRVVLLNNKEEKNLTEEQIDNLLIKEAYFRVKAYLEQSKLDDKRKAPLVDEHLLSLKNCSLTESFLINDKLLNISLIAKDVAQERDLIKKLIQEIKELNNPLAELWLSSDFLPGVSYFFPALDGIGKMDLSPFYKMPADSGGEQKGRLWLNNSLKFSIDKSQIPSLDFFDVIPLSNEWEMRKATMADLKLIHHWMNNTILANTFRQAYSIDKWEEELKQLIDSPVTKPMILSYKNEQCAYLEFYRPAGIAMGNSFLFDYSEIGFHLGIISTELINKKFGRQLMKEIALNLMKNYPRNLVGGIVGEPDINNLGMFNASIKTGLGFHVASIAMPHKCSYIIRYHKN